jgi:hypothetical protein
MRVSGSTTGDGAAETARRYAHAPGMGSAV